MRTERPNLDPVSRIIGECHRSEDAATRIYHQIAEERRRSVVIDGTTVVLDERQAGEFARRFSSEVEPAFWVSKRLKH